MVQTPIYTSQESRSRETFLTLMWAFSHPGRMQTLPAFARADLQRAMTVIGETLLDLETTYFTLDSALDAAFARTSARLALANAAAYHFYPTLDDAGLTVIEQASVGTSLYPEKAATLCIGIGEQTSDTSNHVTRISLTGPGIQGTQQIQLRGVDRAFWTLRERRVRFPLGWDVFFVAPDGVIIGLPRSTQVTLEG